MTGSDPRSAAGAPRQTRHLAAVWFADIAGYTALSASNETEALAVVEGFQKVVHREVARWGGVVVKFLGDGAMARFPSTEGAVASALAVVEGFEGTMAARPGKAKIRVGVHLGEVVSSADGDLYGDGVNVAARLQGEADPGQVVVSPEVARQLRARPEFRLEPLGDRSLKGIAEPVPIFAVEGELNLLTPVADVPAYGAPSGSPSSGEMGVEAVNPSSRNRAKLWAAVAAALLATFVLALGGRFWSGAGVPEAEVAGLSIAVLPFEDLSADPDQAYFSDGMTEDVLIQLSRIADLRVVSRSSVMPFRGTALSTREIAAQLGVGHVLQGSVRRSGDQLRITAQLIHAPTDSQLWAESYDRPFTDIFEIQSDIATRIARELAARLTTAEERRIRDIPTRNVEAYELYLQGRELLNRLTAEDNDRGIERFRRAVEVDPDFARGYAALSRGMTLKGFNYGAGAHWADSAIAMAEVALELAPEEPEARASLGLAYLARGWLRAGSQELAQVLELVPSHAAATGNLGVAMLLLGELGEAVNLFRRSLALDPLMAVGVGRTNLTDAYLILQMYESASTEVERLLMELPGSPVALEREILLALFQGDGIRAAERARALQALHPDNVRATLAVGSVLLFLGEVEEALPLLERAYVAAPGMVMMGQRSSLLYATALRTGGDAAGARAVAAPVRVELEEALARGGEDLILWHNLATALAILEGPAESLDTLHEGLRIVGGAVRVLELNPVHAEVRDDPRFLRILEAAREWEARQRARVDG